MQIKIKTKIGLVCTKNVKKIGKKQRNVQIKCEITESRGKLLEKRQEIKQKR